MTLSVAKKVRVQVDLSETEATQIHNLVERLAVRSRADLLQQAYGTFLWLLNELLAGRRIVSVDAVDLEKLDKYKELSIPAVEPLRFEQYSYLIARPESGYKQLYLKGHNLRVGQLIYKMRANQLSAAEAAADLGLPIKQIHEAQTYYEVNRALIEQEAAAEKQRLDSAGVRLEPGNLPG